MTPDVAALLALVNVVSRKLHTGVGPFEIDIAPAPLNAATMQAIAGVNSAAAGTNVIVTIPTLADNTRVRITIDGVNGIVAPESASVGFLVGDVNNTRSVNAADISSVKARSGQPTTAANFKFDLNVSGGISAADISAVKARSGLVLP